MVTPPPTHTTQVHAILKLRALLTKPTPISCLIGICPRWGLLLACPQCFPCFSAEPPEKVSAIGTHGETQSRLLAMQGRPNAFQTSLMDAPKHDCPTCCCTCICPCCAACYWCARRTQTRTHSKFLWWWRCSSCRLVALRPRSRCGFSPCFYSHSFGVFVHAPT
jgi:hypothetical protein